MLGTLHPLDETTGHCAQGQLWIDVQAPRDVHRREEHVAHLREDMRVRLGLGRGLPHVRKRFLQLAHLVVEIGERSCRVGILEADRRRATLHLAGIEQRGKRLRDVVKDALAVLVRALDLLPALAHAPGGLRLCVAEHVGMPAHELLVRATGNRLEILASALGQQQREEVDLEQEVAELVGELRVVAPNRCVGDLVGLLDRMRDDRALGLLTIPGAVAP